MRVRDYIHRLRTTFSFLEPAVLFGLIVCVFSFWVFLEVSDEVLDGETHAIDTKILMMLRDASDPSNPWGPHWVQEMMRDISGLGGIVILAFVSLGAALYLAMMRKRGQAMYLLATVSAGTLMSNLLKFSYARPRPDLVPHDSYVFTASFPSGHSMMSAVVYLAVGTLLARAHKNRMLKIYFIGISIFITISVGISRVYLGVHWPTDVLAGWMAGAACAITFWLIEWGWQEKIVPRTLVFFRTRAWSSRSTQE